MRKNIIIVSLGFAEFSIRFSSALSSYCDIDLILYEENYLAESAKNVVIDDRVTVHLVKKRDRFKLVTLFANLLITRRPNVVHLEETTSKLTFILALLTKVRCRLYVRVHDPEPHSGADQALSLPVRFSMGLGRHLATILFANGIFCATRIAEKYKREVVVTQHGEILVPEEEQIRRCESRTFLFFGRLEKYKGLEIALDAMDILAKAGIECRLIVAGRGSELRRLGPRMMASSQIDVVSGFVSYADLVANIQKCACVLMPYLDATQSGVLAAAFAGGRPVIASKVGGISEIVRHGENGLLVPPNDSQSLAEQMRVFLETPQLGDKLAAEARRTAVHCLGWDGIVARISHLYE